MNLKNKVKNLPNEPGVYIMKDVAGVVLYVGKAKDLKKRVQSYFRENVDSVKTKALVSKVSDLEVIITPTEVDALILENTLIKKYHPFYNLELKDDKRYPYLKLTTGEVFPRLLVARQYKEDGARYFGPYAGKGSIMRTMKLLRNTFPLRQCGEKLPKKFCLEYQIKRCLGPCVDQSCKEEYRQAGKDLILFLEGRHAELIAELKEKMAESSKKREYEKAALYRDKIRKIEKLSGRQEVVLPEKIDQDVVVFFTMHNEAGIDILIIRGGKVVGNEVVFYKKASDPFVLEKALISYYERKEIVPERIVFEEKLNNFPLLKKWMKKVKNKTVTIVSDKKNELISMAKRNIAFIKIQHVCKEEVDSQVLNELQKELSISFYPFRMECYDISNTGGSNIVGSQVVFIEGHPCKSEYRHYNIKTVVGKPDDYASLREMLSRRCQKLVEGSGNCPDLIIIDGGKGHLSVAQEVLNKANLKIPLISIAKENEDIYLEGKRIQLPKNSQAQKLIQRIRDEAHRFGIAFHRKKRATAMVKSALLDIPGVGAAGRAKLLAAFNTVANVQKASGEQLSEVVSAKLAERIYNYFHKL